MIPYLLPAIRDWSEWSAVFTDAALWRPAVERLWVAEPSLAARTGVGRIETMTAGFPGTCAVFILNESAVIKLFPPLVAGDFDRERAVYRLLDGRLPEMPRLLADGVLRDRIDWPYLVTSFSARRGLARGTGGHAPGTTVGYGHDSRRAHWTCSRNDHFGWPRLAATRRLAALCRHPAG
jgi:hypothetical protein